MKRSHASLQHGLIGGMLLILIYLFSMVLFPSDELARVGVQLFAGDLIVYPAECLLFFLFARLAAQKQYELQRDDSENPLAGVASEGRGAAMVIALIGFLFIIGRWLVLDFQGTTVLIEPVSLFCSVLVLGVLSLIFGALGADRVVKKYRYMDDSQSSMS